MGEIVHNKPQRSLTFHLLGTYKGLIERSWRLGSETRVGRTLTISVRFGMDSSWFSDSLRGGVDGYNDGSPKIDRSGRISRAGSAPTFHWRPMGTCEGGRHV